MSLNQNKNPRRNKQDLCGSVMFPSHFPYGKNCPNYSMVSVCYAPLDWGKKVWDGPIRIWLLGSDPENDAASFSPFPATLLFSAFLIAPRLKQPLSWDTYVLRGLTDFSPGTCTEEELVTLIHKLK